MDNPAKSFEGKLALHGQEARLSEAMRLSQSGDAEAYRSLLEAIETLLKVYFERALRRMGIQDLTVADDIAQEALLAIHTKRNTYDPDQLFTPWLFAIARYKLIDFSRKYRRTSTFSNIEDFENVLEAPVFLETTSASDLKTLMQDLPDRTKKLLELVKIEGLSVAEAAARTQMSESSVKVTIHRALKKLRSNIRGPTQP